MIFWGERQILPKEIHEKKKQTNIPAAMLWFFSARSLCCDFWLGLRWAFYVHIYFYNEIVANT